MTKDIVLLDTARVVTLEIILCFLFFFSNYIQIAVLVDPCHPLSMSSLFIDGYVLDLQLHKSGCLRISKQYCTIFWLRGPKSALKSSKSR